MGVVNLDTVSIDDDEPQRHCAVAGVRMATLVSETESQVTLKELHRRLVAHRRGAAAAEATAGPHNDHLRITNSMLRAEIGDTEAQLASSQHQVQQLPVPVAHNYAHIHTHTATIIACVTSSDCDRIAVHMVDRVASPLARR